MPSCANLRGVSPPEASATNTAISVPERFKVKLTEWDPRTDKNQPSWIRAWMADEVKSEAIDEIKRYHALFVAEIGDDSFSVQDILMSRAQATVYADYFLAQSAMHYAGPESKRGMELMRIAMHMRESAARHAERALTMLQKMRELARERDRENDDGRAVFSAEGE